MNPIEYGSFNGINSNGRSMLLYYSILTFSLALKGRFIQNTFDAGSVIYSNEYVVLGNDGKYYITFINKFKQKAAFVATKELRAFHNTEVIRLSTVGFGEDNSTATTPALGNAIQILMIIGLMKVKS